MPSCLRHLVPSPVFLIWVALGAACADKTTSPAAGPISVAIAPRLDTLKKIGDTVLLTVSVNGQRAGPYERISWTSLNRGVATVDSLGAVRAVAPGSALIVGLVAELGDTATVIVVPATLLQIALTPASITLAPGASSQFAVSGTWSDSSSTVPAVTYSATGGAITAAGLYTAGTTPGTFAVIATQQGGTAADTAAVTIVLPPATLTQLVLTPASVTMAPGGTTQFAVSGTWSDGSSTVPAVTYAATGGTITAGGLYTAGSTAGTFRVIAVQQGGVKADTSAVTIAPPAPTLTQLVLTPASVSLAPGGTAQFAVSGTWSDGSSTVPAVTYAATGGTITAGGLYTAGSTAGTFRVIAVQQGGGKADTSAVTIAPPAPTLTQLVLTPASVTLAPGGTTQFAVSGIWSDGSSTVPAVTYAATGGTITAGGLYTAGTTSGAYQLIATQQGGTKSDTSAVTISSPSTSSLRLLAAARNFVTGAAVNMTAFRTDAQYQQTLLAQYNGVVAENAMKFGVIHPQATQYSFSDADQLVSFAQANGMVIHGHNLVWGSGIPSWVTGGGFNKAQLLQILHDHITTVVGRYAGKLVSWDVVNEPLAWNGPLLNTFWLANIGPEYIDSALVWAHRADPAAKLYINEYSVDSIQPKSDSLLALLQALRARGIPIDGVGFQAHAFPGRPLPSEGSITSNYSRFTNAGFLIRISELDVPIPDSSGADSVVSQALVYRNMLDICLLLQPSCTSFTTWGFTDRYSYIPTAFPGWGRGLPLDSAYAAKPAFDSLVARLRRP